MPPATVPSWLGLPDYLVEEILERLPLSDYVRFTAVCRRWRSIQSDHRRRHAPSPPPMIKLPWLIPWETRRGISPFYSPFEARTYSIKIPKHNNYFSNCGWLFRPRSLFNPISRIHIPFPEPLDQHYTDKMAISPPPDLVLFVIKNGRHLLVFRQGDPRWTKLHLPIAEDEAVNDAITVSKRLYCISSHHGSPTANHLLIVDPVPSPPTVSSYRMEDHTEILPEEAPVWAKGCRPIHLVELDGEMLMVKTVIDKMSGCVLRFRVLRPDVSNRMWTRVESLGRRLLLFHYVSAISLMAADVGLKKNCIYFLDDDWKVFDLRTEKVMDVSFPDFPLLSDDPRHMFMPSVC